MTVFPTVITGLEVLLREEPRELRAASSIGLLCHQASVDSRCIYAKNLLARRFSDRLRRLYSPQHGFRGEKQDNMIVSRSFVDSSTGLEVRSLYGPNLKPDPETFEGIDLLVVDLQDVGTRVYTYIHTMALAMQTARAAGISVMVLDRPNPIGGIKVEGNVLQPDMTSLVGLYPIPMRHGMTIGEMAMLCNEGFGIGADLTVVPMRGWRRSMLFPQTGLPFVPPSPNMPIWETAMVYPGQVIWEGTNVSEGRGTTRPFETFGAPFFDTTELVKRFASRKLPGIHLREIGFEPTFNKWQGQLCSGFHLHVTDTESYEPCFCSLALLQDVIAVRPEAFQWKEPPYEYEFERLPIDLILGSRELREHLENGGSLAESHEAWSDGLNDFLRMRSAYLLYGEDRT